MTEWFARGATGEGRRGLAAVLCWAVGVHESVALRGGGCGKRLPFGDDTVAPVRRLMFIGTDFCGEEVIHAW